MALFGDPQVAEWVWPGERGGPRTTKQAHEMLARFVDHWRRHGFGWWFLSERTARGRRGIRRGSGAERMDTFVGEVGLQWTEVEDRLAVEIGWTIVPSHWNQGYATEAARAALAHGLETIGLDEIFAFTLPHNAASRRVAEKVGMEVVGEVNHAGLPHVLYRLGRAER